MSTPFLMAFAHAVVLRLLAAEVLVVAPGDEERVMLFVANYLGTEAQGGSLISGLERALLACPEVDELFADLERLKELVDDLARP